MSLQRRTLLTLPTLTACTAPFPTPAPDVTTPTHPLLLRSAEAHGLPRYRTLTEITLSYTGTWAPLIGRIQPLLVDQRFRGPSTERIRPREGTIEQHHQGPAGRKHVLRRPDTVEVSFNDEPATDAPRRAAAALVADGYMLFPLGPLWLGEHRALALTPAGTETIQVNNTPRPCHILTGRMTPGLGFSPSDRLTLWIGRDDALMYRIRFGLEGFAPTRNAVAEVDCWNHADFAGLVLPRIWHERLIRPAPLPVHDWTLAALALDGRDAAT
jgi:hypothetical protein